MNSLIFLNTIWFFQNFLTFLKILFPQCCETITMKLLVQLPGKFMSVVWNIVMKKYAKFVRLRSFSKLLKLISTSNFVYKFIWISENQWVPLNRKRKKLPDYLIDRVDAPFVATVLIVAIFTITCFKSLFLHVFVLIFETFLSKSMK